MDDFYGTHYGLYMQETWRDHIEFEYDEQKIWNEELEEWETDDEHDDYEDTELDALEKKAKESVSNYKKPFDKKERGLMKDLPPFAARMWFYLLCDETREKEIENFEKSIKKQQIKKKMKIDREKLFKRLNGKKRRR